MADYKFIGKPVRRVDGEVKISGAAQFVDDLQFGPDLLYAAIVESTQPTPESTASMRPRPLLFPES